MVKYVIAWYNMVLGCIEKQKKQNRVGQSWNPNYSIITPKSGQDSIYPVTAFSSSYSVNSN